MKLRLTHLALVLALTTLLSTSLGIYATYRMAEGEFRELLEDDLARQAEILARVLAAGQDAIDDDRLRRLLGNTFEADDEETLLVNVVDLRRRQGISNLDYPDWPDSTDSGPVRLAFDGHQWFGRQWRQDDILVQMLRRDDLHRELQEDIVEDIITPALIGNGVNLLLLTLLMGLMLWPLSRLVRQLEQRSPAALTPLSLRAPTREVASLAAGINQLITDVNEVLGRQRRFASDVAHELRTPLTTLKLELAGGDPDLAAIRAEVDRMARVIEQLLILARLDQGRWRHRFERLSLDSALASGLQRFRQRPETRDYPVSERLAPLQARVEPTLLGILLDNLLNNVLRHCPPGTGIDVVLQQEAGEVVLEVSDRGAGIDADLRQDMARGSTRLDSKSQGLGLGLAICHQVAHAHGGHLRFLARADGEPGLRVQLRLPS
ncbi:hypothetical protein C7I36_07950 [Zobellella taiwanensis]|uniref:histidine kinase n=1 Tax=Zobellella taiwanensis TaxID=347535 RepID=A0A2P7R0V1_9GAMM|nr:ATP-binding protein [Zobellella taiwanensis]PSJ43850.1 hypothetical protein C7I36_07950 [Zobellella taiwanensis]